MFLHIGSHNKDEAACHVSFGDVTLAAALLRLTDAKIERACRRQKPDLAGNDISKVLENDLVLLAYGPKPLQGNDLREAPCCGLIMISTHKTS